MKRRRNADKQGGRTETKIRQKENKERLVYACVQIRPQLIANRKFVQIIITAIVNVEINIALYSRQASGVSMLPELPLSGILDLVNIIMRYPIRVVIKHGSVKIIHLKLIISIYYRFNMVSVLNNMKPCKYFTLKIFNANILRLVFDIKDGREVTVNQNHIIQEKVRLLTC